MINQNTKGNADEFMVFMLLYASYADYELSMKELTLIKSKYDGLLVDEVLSRFEKMSDYERLNYIMQNKSNYIRTNKDLDLLFEEINKQFNVDGDYSKLEKGLSNFLKHMMVEEWK